MAGQQVALGRRAKYFGWQAENFGWQATRIWLAVGWQACNSENPNWFWLAGKKTLAGSWLAGGRQAGRLFGRRPTLPAACQPSRLAGGWGTDPPPANTAGSDVTKDFVY